MSKSVQNSSSKNQSRSHSLSGKNYMKLGRNITKTYFSPLKKTADGQPSSNQTDKNEKQIFEDFINTPFSLDFLRNQIAENSKQSISRYQNSIKKPISALNHHSGSIDKAYLNMNATWNVEDNSSIDEEDTAEEELLKLQRKLKRKRKETAVFKSIERDVLPSWVKAKSPENSYEFKYQIDFSPVKAKSPSAFISKQQNFSIKKSNPQPRLYDTNASIRVCKKNPLVKLDEFSQTVATFNQDENDGFMKFINEGEEHIDKNTQRDQQYLDFKTQQNSPKHRQLINVTQNQSTDQGQPLEQTTLKERGFMSVNTSRNVSPEGFSIKRNSKLQQYESPTVEIKNNIPINIQNQTASTAYNSYKHQNSNEFDKKRKEYKYNKLNALEELEQLQVEERHRQKQINIPQIGKYSVRKPLFSPRATSNEIYTNDLVRENYSTRLYQVSKIRDFSTYVSRKELFSHNQNSPDQGYYNHNYKPIEENSNNVLFNISKSSPRKTVMTLEQYPEQHVLLDYQIDKIPKLNTKTLANFSKMVGRKGNSLLENSLMTKQLRSKPYSLKL